VGESGFTDAITYHFGTLGALSSLFVGMALYDQRGLPEYIGVDRMYLATFDITSWDMRAMAIFALITGTICFITWLLLSKKEHFKKYLENVTKSSKASNSETKSVNVNNTTFKIVSMNNEEIDVNDLFQIGRRRTPPNN